MVYLCTTQVEATQAELNAKTQEAELHAQKVEELTLHLQSTKSQLVDVDKKGSQGNAALTEQVRIEDVRMRAQRDKRFWFSMYVYFLFSFFSYNGMSSEQKTPRPGFELGSQVPEPDSDPTEPNDSGT